MMVVKTNIVLAVLRKLSDVQNSYTTYKIHACLYNEWYSNITREDLDNKIIASAINFWFKDEDTCVGKVWNYFKNIG